MLSIICDILPAIIADADIMEEYRETKNGITLVSSIGLHDSAARKMLDAFLKRLGKELTRPYQTKIMMIVEWNLQAPWNAVIGYDTLRFDRAFIDEPHRQQKDAVQEVIIDQNIPVDTSYKPPKEVAIDWSGSHDRTKKELGLKILYRWPASDSNVIFFDRIYSLAKYGLEHLEEIKKDQKRIEIRYQWEWLISVLTIDTSEIKKIPLQSLGFDPNHIEVETKNKVFIWLGSVIILLVLILFFIFKKWRSNSTEIR